ncbi:MAG: tRNA (adenosine(37)-N6)-threonylcarbamoyltransferase complex ATPase subunit type 1 TsaE [Candidatus Adiutrix sp.]|jgi:tRNA threonylcarbamoyladenosine biosynthesis protein TsaE|nr:tRNA (adenosine(37)-N6)-threonylcarbamoyltransferase complex ATPase subunit type 1 TsaE [Candidatus Adiutrix sp.]
MDFSSEIFLPGAADTWRAGFGLGRRLGDFLGQGRLSLPFLITLSGDLGAGKTTFCQGLGQALGIIEPGEIVSPTFTLANEYHGLVDIFHLDVYRLESVEQFREAGLEEYLYRPGLSLVEWPEKLPEDFWPDKRLDLAISFQDGGRLLKALSRPAAIFNIFS